MNDDDTVASCIVLVAIVCIIAWACAGCSIPGKIDGDERPPEATDHQRGSLSSAVAQEPVERAALTPVTPILRSVPDPAPHRAELPQPEVQPTVMVGVTPGSNPPLTNVLRKRVRKVCPRSWSKEQWEAYKSTQGYN